MDGGLRQRREELGWPVEVRHLEVSGTNPFRLVRVRAGGAGQVGAGRQLGCSAAPLQVLDLLSGSQAP
jgi:hypothetical protein